MAEFLRESEWIPGVYPLFREPPGFVLSSEFRAKFPEYSTSRGRADFSYKWRESRKRRTRARVIIEQVEDEVRWALMLFGLGQSATPRDIASTYRKLAKQVHPDLAANEADRLDRESRMKDLNTAYEILRHR